MAEFAFQEEGLIERIRWFIRLRWIAIIGVSLTVIFVKRIAHIPIFSFGLFSVIALLAVYNLASFFYLNQIKQNKSISLALKANRLANFQISFDLFCLAALIHFSGGIENPFVFYFIFHMIIASTLLSRRASFLQATFSVVLFFSVVILEYWGVLPHYCLKGFISSNQHDNLTYITGVSFVFMSTLYIAVYMASSIAKRLREREIKLKELNLLLEEKDRIKSEYVLRVSHDIKEHLSAIQGCLEPVADGITGELNLQQKDLLLRANQRTGKLLFFVKALLEITRIKLSKHIEMDYFSLKKTIDNAMNFVEAKAKDKGIIISSKIEPNIDVIWGAQVYIEETVANLLANSLKYTPANGRVDLAVLDKGENILIEISDNGIGIPREEIPKLFDEFFRGSNAKKTEHEGTGLGLSIAKQVIERHKGRIWVNSEGEGKGSKFSFTLPKSA